MVHNIRLWCVAVVAIALVACESNPSVTSSTSSSSPARVAASGHGAGEADRKAFIAEHAMDDSGELTREVFINFRRARFAEADLDGKGTLSEDEYVDEYATRLEQQIDAERKGHSQQTLARFNALDRNKDGFISPEEYKASGDRAWQQFDSQNTGVIRLADHAGQSQARSRSVLGMPTSHSITGFFDIYDESGEGVITRASYDKQRQAAFAATDLNGDGKLSLEEYQDEFEARVDRRADQVRAAQIKQAHVRFGVLDVNKDNAISLDEYLATGLRSFERWDTNGDNIISDADPLPAPRVAPTTSAADNKR